MTILFVFTGFCWLWTRPTVWLRPAVVLGTSFLLFFLVRLSSPYKIDVYYALGEFKWVLPFFLYPFFLALIVKSEARPGVGTWSDLVRRFVKLQIIALFVLSSAALILGYKRETVLFGFSINAAYGVVYMIGTFFSSITKKWALLTIITIGLLGSTTATFVSIIVIGLKIRLHIAIKAVLGVLAMGGFYTYSLLFRAKDFAHTDFSNVDRGQIVQYYLDLIHQQFAGMNYLIGWGNGHQFQASNTATGMKVIDGWFLPVFTKYNVFSNGTHDELLRIFIDYGVIGVVFIYISLQRILPLATVVLILALGVTNTTLFSSNNVYILALVAAVYTVARRKGERINTGSL